MEKISNKIVEEKVEKVDMKVIDKFEEEEKHKKELEEAKKELGILEIKIENEEEEDENELQENTVILSKPLFGKKEIFFNTDKIKGKVIARVKDDYFKRRKRKSGVLPELDDHYFIMMAEELTGIRYNHFFELGAKDYNKVLNFVRDFLQED